MRMGIPPVRRRVMRERRESSAASTVSVPARLIVRKEQQAPGSAMSIQRFIELVEDFENNRHVGPQRTNTRYMITRVRKIFYGKDGWDNYLITSPDAVSVDRPYQTRELVTGRFTLSFPWVPDLIDVVRKRYEVRDSARHEPAIFRGQELRLRDGLWCDIGHVFAGLDAFNHPGPVDGLGTINITSNVDAVTWVGDLGSVLAEWKFWQLHPDRGSRALLTIAEAQAKIDEYASARDMLGNIDAYAIQSEFNISGTPTPAPHSRRRRIPKVSDILKAYYLRDYPARSHRYSRFAHAIGLRGWNGTRFSNESARVSYYTDEVNDAAALYVGANTASAWYGFVMRGSACVGMAMNQGAERLIRAFFREIKSNIRREPSP